MSLGLNANSYALRRAETLGGRLGASYQTDAADDTRDGILLMMLASGPQGVVRRAGELEGSAAGERCDSGQGRANRVEAIG